MWCVISHAMGPSLPFLSVSAEVFLFNPLPMLPLSKWNCSATFQSPTFIISGVKGKNKQLTPLINMMANFIYPTGPFTLPAVLFMPSEMLNF